MTTERNITHRNWAAGPAQHCISDALLMDYAIGAMDRATAALIATHLQAAPDMAAHLDTLDALGGEVLDSAAKASMPANALDDMFALLDASEPPGDMRKVVAPVARPDDLKNLPEPIAKLLDDARQPIKWKRMIPGVSQIELDWLEGESRVRLLKVAGGTAMPHHTHDGRELTLILCGAYRDETGRYAAGDVAEHEHDDHVDHQPIAEPGQDCICFAVTTAPLRLTGRFTRLLNPFVDI